MKAIPYQDGLFIFSAIPACRLGEANNHLSCAWYIKSYLRAYTWRAFDMKSRPEVPLQSLVRIDQSNP